MAKRINTKEQTMH